MIYPVKAPSSPALHPVRDLVLVRPDSTVQSRSGLRDDGSRFDLLLPPSAQHEEPYGLVLAVGPDVCDVAISNRVLFDPERCIRASDDAALPVGSRFTGGPLYDPAASLLVRECDIIARIETDLEASEEEFL